MAQHHGVGSPGPASPALRSAQGVQSRREAVPRERLAFTLGRAFTGAADADRASAKRTGSPIAPMGRSYEIR